MPFWYLIWLIQTRLHAKGFVVPQGGTIVYRIFSNYNELCTKYHILSLFSIKVIVIQQKVSCLQIVSIMYWQYILISPRMRRLHFSLSYVGQVCNIKRPSSFTIWITIFRTIITYNGFGFCLIFRRVSFFTKTFWRPTSMAMPLTRYL